MWRILESWNACPGEVEHRGITGQRLSSALLVAMKDFSTALGRVAQTRAWGSVLPSLGVPHKQIRAAS